MKKFFCFVLVFILIGTTAFAASFEIEDNPDYKHPAFSKYANGNSNAYYDTSKPVSYDNKSTSNSYFWAYSTTWFSPNYKFAWAEGASGSDDDYAISLTATSDDVLSEGYLYLFYVGDNVFKNRDHIVTEFDVKLATTTDRFAVSDVTLWGSGVSRVLFDSNGKIYGTDHAYSADTWMHVKLDLDYVSGKCSMWVDDAKVIDNVAMVSGTWNKNSRLSMYISQRTQKESGEARASFSVDNVLVYAVGKDVSEYVSMNVAHSDGTPASVTEAPVNPVINLQFPADFDTTLLNNENISIANSQGNNIPCDLAVDSAVSAVVITPERQLSYEADYHIRLSDEIRKECKSTNPALGKLTFTTGNMRDVVISDFALSSDVAGKVAQVRATLTNNTSDLLGAGVILAIYNEHGGLVSIKRVNISLSSGTNTLTDEISVTLPVEFDSNYAVKLFVTPSRSYNIIDEYIYVG